MVKSNAEYQAAWRQRRNALIDQLQAENEQLRAEIARLTDAPAAPETPSDLPMSAQKKLDAHKARLAREYEARVEEAAHIMSDEWRKKDRIYDVERLEAFERMMNRSRNAVMELDEYNIIVKCLHPDGRRNRTDKELAEAFQIFTSFKPKLVDDEETKRQARLKVTGEPLPQTREEMLARKTMKRR